MLALSVYWRLIGFSSTSCSCITGTGNRSKHPPLAWARDGVVLQFFGKALMAVPSPSCCKHSSSTHWSATARFSQTALAVLYLNFHRLCVASARAAAHFADPRRDVTKAVRLVKNTVQMLTLAQSSTAVKWDLTAAHGRAQTRCLCSSPSSNSVLKRLRHDNQTEQRGVLWSVINGFTRYVEPKAFSMSQRGPSFNLAESPW